MAGNNRYRPILPSTVKPSTYMNDELIKAAVDTLDATHHEFEVARAVISILRKFFPMKENWTIVPEFLVPEKKRPDYCVEKFIPGSSPFFKPKIFVEIKSNTGATTEKAIDQITSSMTLTVDRLGESYACFLIIVRGKRIGFFEYHNDRSNLHEDGVVHHHGAISFNHPQQQVPVVRPYYKGTGVVSYQDEYTNESLPDQEGVFLDLAVDDVDVSRVLEWMKDNEPAAEPRGN